MARVSRGRRGRQPGGTPPGSFDWGPLGTLTLILASLAVVAIMIGTTLAFVFGLWLVHEAGYGYFDGWIVAAYVLLLAANAMGGAGGKRDERTAKLARELAASGDAPSAELQARVRDPISLALSYGSGLLLVALLAIMVWKPGA